MSTLNVSQIQMQHDEIKRLLIMLIVCWFGGYLMWAKRLKCLKKFLLYSIIFNIKIPNSIVKFYTKKCELDKFLNINES